MNLVLQLKDVTKCYGKTMALNNLTLTLTEGIYGLLGPNGAGKSTLMYLITDNLLPDKGVITYNGESILKLGSKYYKDIGYMPQQQQLYDSYTAERFLFYIAALKGLSRSEASKQVPQLLERVNLFDKMHLRLGFFSGGMKQRILIAQALLGNPKILILDEPTAGLDPKERIRIRNLISEVSFNKIVIIATHVVSDIEFISKQVLLLKQGQLIDQGSPFELAASIHGKVFEIKTTPNYIQEISSTYKVGNISRDDAYVYLRVVSDTPPEPWEYVEVKPTLEDVYLYRFDTGDVQ